MAMHLSTCPGCTSAFQELQHEQELYAHYRRDVEVTPAQWNIVQARLEQEKDTGPQQPQSRLHAWFGGAAASSRKFYPAIVAALLLIMVGITAGIIYLSRHNSPGELVSRPVKQAETSPLAGQKQELPDGSNQKNETVAGSSNGKENNPNRQMLTAATNAAERKKAVTLARLPHPLNRRTEQFVPDNPAQSVEAVTDRESINDVFKSVRGSVPGATGDFDFEIARHTERAELLLRSFRNVRLAATDHALDVSYEKKQSRKLLYQNITLRRESIARGDQPTAELLSQLEPILLDIANLPNRAKARDVRSIEQHMAKQEIVATLQVRTLVASN
jgi:hypothetical protein